MSSGSDPRDEGATRPAPAVGQRWLWCGKQEWTLTGIDSEGEWNARNQRSSSGIFSLAMLSSSDATYLGMAAPPAPVGVAAAVGQRRRGMLGGAAAASRKVPGDFVCSRCGCERWSGKGNPVTFACLNHNCVCDPKISSGTPAKREADEAGTAATAAVLAPSPVRLPKREVRTTGGTWINYDKMADPDPFEAYPLRRVDGVVAAVATGLPVRVVGSYCAADLVEEADVARRMDMYYRRRHKPAPAPTPGPPREDDRERPTVPSATGG